MLGPQCGVPAPSEPRRPPLLLLGYESSGALFFCSTHHIHTPSPSKQGSWAGPSGLILFPFTTLLPLPSSQPSPEAHLCPPQGIPPPRRPAVCILPSFRVQSLSWGAPSQILSPAQEPPALPTVPPLFTLFWGWLAACSHHPSYSLHEVGLIPPDTRQQAEWHHHGM